MTALALTALAIAAAIVQVSAVPAAFSQPIAAPVLPIALLAGWAAVRQPREVWPVPLAAGIVLGAMSDVRVGMFILALLPALVILTLVRARERRGEGHILRYVAFAAASAAAGGISYVVLLSVVSGTTRALPAATPALVSGVLSTGVLAALLAACLWPLRPRSGGLFA